MSDAVRLIDVSHVVEDGMVTPGTARSHHLRLSEPRGIAEHLCNLAALPDAGFRFSAVPVKVKGFGTFPVRAHAAVP
jgi:arylformamidase